jgi:hypothetical protein
MLVAFRGLAESAAQVVVIHSEAKMAEVDTSIYRTQPQQPTNLLGMIHEYASTQNQLNQAALFAGQQKFGEHVQNTVDPETGLPDYNEALARAAHDPVVAPYYNTAINEALTNGKANQDLIASKYTNTNNRIQVMGNLLSGVIKGHANQQSIPQSEVLGTVNKYYGTFPDTDAKQIKQMLASLGIDPKTGKYSGNLAYTQALQIFQNAQGALQTSQQTFLTAPQLSDAVKRQAPTGAETITPKGAVPGATMPGAIQQGMGPTPGAQPPAAPQPTAPPMQGGGTAGAKPVQTQPVTPPQGGPVTTTLGTVEKSRLEEFPKYQQGVYAQGTKANELEQIMQEFEKAQAGMKTGGGAATFMRLGQALQQFGFSNATVDKMANGSLSSSQEVDKLGMQFAMSMLKRDLMGTGAEGGAGRILQTEVMSYMEKNPNLATDPRTIAKIFQFIRSQNDVSLNRSKFLQMADSNWKNHGTTGTPSMSSITDFEPWFNEKLKGVLNNNWKKAKDAGLLPPESTRPDVSKGL